MIGDEILDAGSIINIIILVVLIALSAFFSSAETALTTVSKFSLRSLADNGNKRASRVLKVTENSGKLISNILIGNNIVNISASSLTTTFVTKAFGSSAVGIATGALTLIVLLFGEITPKTLAQRYNLKISLLYIDIIQFLMIVLTPVIFIVNKIADFMIEVEGGGHVLSAYSLTHNASSSSKLVLFQNAFSQKRSGDILYSLVPTWIPTLKEREDNYARYSKRFRVPLYLYGAGVPLY